MQNNILVYFGNLHAQYLHARGKIATKILIKTLNCQPYEKVLEIGFGTGTTLVHIFSNNKKTRFYGIDKSVLMFNKAKARLRFCSIAKKVHLHLSKQSGQIPFENNSFDKIYLESVLAIQEGKELENYLKEIKRVLRPNGALIMNETIWLDTTAPDEIINMNESCKQMFGIIQCNSNYRYLRDWENLLASLGFECESIIKLDEARDDLPSQFRFPYNLFSSAFTFFGKVKSSLSSSMRKEKRSYFKKMKQLQQNNKALMGGFIIKALNKR